MGLLKSLRAITSHALNRRAKLRAIGRFARWQLVSRLHEPGLVVPFVNDARLLVHNGMTGATGNIYMGLHEFEDMAFVLHVLRPDDLFVDVGANVGSYTVLAGACAGARCIAVEPVAKAFDALLDNVHLNRIEDGVVAMKVALGAQDGTLQFIVNRDTVNRVATSDDAARSDNGSLNVMDVPVRRLDDVVAEARATHGWGEPAVIKIDVEGYEQQVVDGGGGTLESPSLLAVIMETNRAARRYGFDERELRAHMRELGFDPYAYRPFERRLDEIADSEPQGRAQNTILVRNIEEVRRRIESAAAFHVLGQSI